MDPAAVLLCVVLYQLEVPVSAAFAPHQEVVEQVTVAACPEGDLEIIRRVSIAGRPVGLPTVLRIPLPPRPPAPQLDVAP